MSQPYKEVEVEIDGIFRIMAVPTSGDVNPAEGIPRDAFPVVQTVFRDAPEEFVTRLWAHLWQFGLRRPNDYTTASANNVIAQALKLTIRKDVLTLKHAMKEVF